MKIKNAKPIIELTKDEAQIIVDFWNLMTSDYTLAEIYTDSILQAIVETNEGLELPADSPFEVEII